MSSYSTYISSINSNMNKYFVIVSSAIGIPCNIISIFIFARLMRNKTNMGFLYVCQCSVDLYLLLATLLVIRSSTVVFPFTIATINDDWCRFANFIRRFSIHVSSWMPVLITFDRFIFVLYEQDQRFRFMKKKMNLALIILVIFICLAIIDIPNLLFGLVINAKTGARNCTAVFAILFTADILSTFFRTYIPMILMVVFNMLMLRKIFSKNRLTYNQSSLKRKEYQFTIAVMAYSVYFFVLNFPLAVFYIFYDVNLYNGALNGDFGTTYTFLNNIFINLSYCIQPLSLFMNFAFNKLFRHEIMTVCGKVLGNGLGNRIQPSYTTSRGGVNRSL